MFQSVLKPLRQIVSGIVVKQLVAHINHYHRIQAIPEFCRTGQVTCETLWPGIWVSEFFEILAQLEVIQW
jgi:hypothetical protein